MDQITEGSPLKSERQKTNDNLNFERERADETLESQTEKVENETNVTFENNRLKADHARTQRREKIDNKAQSGINVSSQVLSERRAEDSEIETERLAVDMALGTEREAKERVIRNLVDHVREITDKNLLRERIKSDWEASQSQALLAAEQFAHSGTKAKLTTREDFLAIVSHDLRNPIGTISSCAELLLSNNSFAGLDEEALRWIEIIKRNADSSLRLIGDLLDMERVAVGKLALSLKRNFIADVVKESVENHQQIALLKSISLTVQKDLASKVLLLDKDRITQVLSNLIGNALKFTPRGGTVTIDMQEFPEEIQVSVSDTGLGIAEDKMHLIFERFAQIANKDRRGLGLGLYISKMIVDLHHGKLWVTSQINKGSTFYFTLPKS